ncbi:TlpA disulfide reductase family protein, partial [Anaerolinea sp.]|uniref:TlpA disulfide reductase family protein n=1 Tax=Anaerolinea sp. TaxID=1872519 RepID=UPI002ACE4C41
MVKISAYRWFALLSLFLTALWIGVSSIFFKASEQTVALAQRGFLAPDFELRSIDGGTIRLSDLQGKVVILNFWASWCPPCREEMPALQRVYQVHQSQGVEVIAVNATSQDTLSDVLNFVQDNGLTFSVLLDEQGDVQSTYRISGLPTTFFIDREGKIRELIIGGP